ncbi:MAG: ABC transporter ATP-binding protein [Pseudomonadota bacterium]
MSKASIIRLENVKKVFYTDELETHALSDVSFSIEEGDFVSIAGPSGSGKSTLLSILGLLDTLSSGKYHLAGHDTETLKKAERAAIRNKEIGFIFQSFNLISDLSVEENVELPLTYRTQLKRAERRDMVASALKRVEMDHRKGHFPSQLSGGQQQRVAIARAVAGKPAVLLADEPTGNLDSGNAAIVMDLLTQLNKDGATICMVTHDPRSEQFANRIIRILDGKLEQDVAQREPREELVSLVEEV